MGADAAAFFLRGGRAVSGVRRTSGALLRVVDDTFLTSGFLTVPCSLTVGFALVMGLRTRAGADADVDAGAGADVDADADAAAGAAAMEFTREVARTGAAGLLL